MRWLKDWLIAKREAAGRAAFMRGWDWASGELLRGTDPEHLEAQLDFTFDSNPFDYGAQAAISQWHARETLAAREGLKSALWAANCGCGLPH